MLIFIDGDNQEISKTQDDVPMIKRNAVKIIDGIGLYYV